MEVIRWLPLRLRSIEVTAPIWIGPCGPQCLAKDDSIDHAIPGGMALKLESRAEGALEGVLFGTRRGTYIKRTPARGPSFGRNGRFSSELHRRAIEMLRNSDFDGICRPERECDCSLEFRAVSGAIAWVPFSMHAPRLAELYQIHPLHTREQVTAFLRSAWAVLSELNRLGISHGDPAFYNFIVGTPPVLIDLDACVWTGEKECLWDQNVFLYSAVVPVLAGFLSAKEIAAFVEELMTETALVRGSGAEVLVPAITQTVEYNRCARLTRSLAMNNRALNLQLAETVRKLNARLQEVRGQSDMYLNAARERLQALEAAHAEMDRLRAIAQEREQVILRLRSR